MVRPLEMAKATRKATKKATRKAVKKAVKKPKKAKKAKKPKKTKKAKRVSKIAKGRMAKVMVFKGRKEKTVGGMKASDLVKNKNGRVVSKKALGARSTRSSTLLWMREEAPMTRVNATAYERPRKTVPRVRPR